jgi:predicted RecA/RadA family phage recombinase
VINYVQKGCSVEVTFAAAVVSGEGRLVGSLFVVADHDVDAGAKGTGLTEGVVELTRDAADVFTQGLLVYWNAGAKEVTIDANAGANKLIGVSMEALAAAAGNVKVRLNGVSVS